MATMARLPQLQIQQMENPTDSLGKILQLKNMMQQGKMQGLQLQQEQMNVDDQKKWRQAFMDAQGDPEKTLQGASKMGVSPDSILKYKTSLVDQKQKMATLTKDQLDNQKAIIGLADSSAQRVLTAAPEDRPAVYANERIQLLNSGQFQPQDLPEQYPGDEFVKLHAFAANAAKKQIAETEEAQSKAQTAQSEATIKGAQAEATKNYGALSPEMAKSKYQFILNRVRAKQPVPQGDMQWAQAYEASEAKSTTQSDTLGVSSTSTSKPSGLAAVGAGPKGNGAPQQNVKESLVDLIGQYKTDPMTLSRLQLKHPDILALVHQKYPDWDQTNYTAKAKAMVAFTSGPQSKEINAINTGMGHIGVLGDAIDALKNGDIKAMNRVANFVGVQSGETPVTTFKTIIHRVAPELAAAYVQGGGTGGERTLDEKDFDPSLGAAQLKSNVGISVRLLRSKIGSLENQYKNTVGRDDFEQRFITGEAQRALQKFSPQQGSSNAATSGMTRIKASDGSLHDIPSANLQRAKQIDPGLQVIQ